MSPKGRPKSENPKAYRFEIRLTKDDLERLESCAMALNVTRTEVINRGIALVEKEINKK